MKDFLIISPHIDDEVLGCGGVLDDRFHVHYCGVEKFRVVSREVRLSEAKDCAEFFGFTYSISLDNIVNEYKVSNLISQIEQVIAEIRPTTIFLPYPSYNQDHRAVLDASLTALRPHDKNHQVSNILLYEEIQVGGWPYREDLINGKTYNPNCYFNINIDRKLQGYACHASQVRAMRSPELLRNLAGWRGFQGGFEFAEAFMAVKLSSPAGLNLGIICD